MSMYRCPKGPSCCHLTSNSKRGSWHSGTRASLFQNMHVCVHKCLWGKASGHPTRTQDWSGDCNVTGLCSWVGYVYSLPLLSQEIYCPRYLWATNSHCSRPWIDTAAVQSRNLIGTAGRQSLLWCYRILLPKIPPFSGAHLRHLSVRLELWLCLSLCFNSTCRKRCINSNLSSQYEFMQNLHASCCVYLSSVPTQLLW